MAKLVPISVRLSLQFKTGAHNQTQLIKGQLRNKAILYNLCQGVQR